MKFGVFLRSIKDKKGSKRLVVQIISSPPFRFVFSSLMRRNHYVILSVLWAAWANIFFPLFSANFSEKFFLASAAAFLNEINEKFIGICFSLESCLFSALKQYYCHHFNKTCRMWQYLNRDYHPGTAWNLKLNLSGIGDFFSEYHFQRRRSSFSLFLWWLMDN